MPRSKLETMFCLEFFYFARVLCRLTAINASGKTH